MPISTDSNRDKNRADIQDAEKRLETFEKETMPEKLEPLLNEWVIQVGLLLNAEAKLQIDSGSDSPLVCHVVDDGVARLIDQFGNRDKLAGALHTFLDESWRFWKIEVSLRGLANPGGWIDVEASFTKA